MDLTTLGFAAGSAWLSGINLYATVFILGLLQRFNLAHLPGDLSYLAHGWVVILSGALYLIQFIADKIPAVDSAWDMLHTFIRVPAGALLAATAFAHFDPSVRIAAFLLGGGIALSSHSAKTASKLVVNASPEPFSNVAVSLVTDFIALAGTLLMAVHPVVILIIVVIALVATTILVRAIWKMIHRWMDRKKLSQSTPAAA